MLTTRAANPEFSVNTSEAANANSIDYVELYVSNVVQAAYFFRAALGFVPLSKSGLETGGRTQESIVLGQGDIRLLVTAPLVPDCEVAEHVRAHGDAVKDVAFETADAGRAFDQAVNKGARPVMEPTTLEDDKGCVVKATIAASGDTVHSFIQRDGCVNNFLPHYEPIYPLPRAAVNGLIAIDHVALGVETNQLDRWVDFYVKTMGFHLSHQEDVSTEYSSMKSRVVQNTTGLIKFPMMEPAPGKRKSQIQEYLDFNRGPGAQHLAFLTNDIVSTVRSLRANGIEFLNTPEAYYDMLEERVGSVEEDVELLRDCGILVDREGSGYLMQIFSKPIQSRPTLFMEVIQRKGACGFGGGNIGALFQALERQQALRGSL